MPRADRLGAFRNGGVENSNNNNHQENEIQEESNNTNKKVETTIDFNLYLREPKYTLNDVILPQTTKTQVDLILSEIDYQDLIYQEWGMGEKHKLDKALSINFSGEPGTGKTITAEALAHALKLKFLDIPYQQLESKFVGETPKNITRAFEFAASQNAVLFFDEADSFLGKRLENVAQATDTAVNLTRSVMLKQLSAYKGIVIFATNLITNYDPAFISRIRWKITFDLPDEEARAKIWQVQIPEQLPLDESVNFGELAKQFDEISGRDIKNAVLKAVVAAASEDKPKEQKRVTQSHFIEAITSIIEANKAALKSEYVLTPVEGNVPLPSKQENTDTDTIENKSESE